MTGLLLVLALSLDPRALRAAMVNVYENLVGISSSAACANGLDDDGDTFTDFAGVDPGCTGAGDLSEYGTAACDDGADNDGHGDYDYPDDSGCSSPSDASEQSAGDCDDGADDDSDGATDWPADPGCITAADSSELGTNQCDDGVDNDGDTATDYPDDTGCTSIADSSEYGATACDDGLDNDSDTKTDLADAGCTGASDTSEQNASVQCDDGADNDNDGVADHADAGCANESDASEHSAGDCDDGNDDDADGFTDYQVTGGDPGCSSIADASELNAAIQCDDGADNDADTLVDYPDDNGCTGPTDNTETNPGVACNDAVDNDGDGATDYPGDPGCSSAADTSELGANQCDNGLDDDGDSAADYPDDPGCTSIGEASELGTNQCDNGSDDDGDLVTDYPDDPGCTGIGDTSEIGTTQCDNNADDDLDGFIDYPDDPGCSSPTDTDEASSSPMTVSIDKQCSAKTGSTIASPAYCNFMAVATHTDPDVKPYHHLKYVWSFGDGGSSGTGTWSKGANALTGTLLSRNAARHPVTGHIYEAAGTYTVTVTVTDYAGNTAQATDTVTVVSEDTAWDPATKTWCVSTSGTFTGCPAGATQVTSSDYDASLHLGLGERTLFRGAETFVASVDPAATSANANRRLIGCFSDAGLTCATRPTVTYTTDGTLHSGPGMSGTVVRDIIYDFASTQNGDGNPTLFNYYSFSQTGTDIVRDMTLLRVDALDVGYCPNYTVALNVDQPYYDDRIAIQDVTCRSVDVSGGGWAMGFISGRYGWFAGNDYTSQQTAPAGTNGMRGMGQDRLAFEHNATRCKPGPGDETCAIQWRSCAAPTASAGCDRDDRYVVLWDNYHFDDGGDGSAQGGQAEWKITNTHNNNEQGLSANKYDWIVDSNLITVGPTYGAGVRGSNFGIIFGIDGLTGITVSNNVADLRAFPDFSPVNPSATQALVAEGTGIPYCSNLDCDTDADWYIYNNTAITDEPNTPPSGVLCAAGDGVTNGYCFNNVWYNAVATTGCGTTTPSGTWAGSGGNVVVCDGTDPFPFASALSATSEAWNPHEATPASAGALDDTGRTFTGGGADGWLYHDLELDSRPKDGGDADSTQEWDAGAIER